MNKSLLRACVTVVVLVLAGLGSGAVAASEAEGDRGGVLEPGYDFGRFDRDVLIELCHGLADRVRELEAELRELTVEADEPTASSLDDRFALLVTEIRRLSRENEQLAGENEALRRLLTRVEPSDATSIDDHRDHEASADGDEPQYRYEYDMYRIREETEVDIELVRRRTLGGETVLVEREDRFRDDVIGLRVFFRNDEPRAGRFSMAILVGRIERSFRGDRPEVLGRATHSTPVLEPGELYQFDLEVRTDEARRVSVAEIGRVLFFAEP